MKRELTISFIAVAIAVWVLPSVLSAERVEERLDAILLAGVSAVPNVPGQSGDDARPNEAASAKRLQEDQAGGPKKLSESQLTCENQTMINPGPLSVYCWEPGVPTCIQNSDCDDHCGAGAGVCRWNNCCRCIN